MESCTLPCVHAFLNPTNLNNIFDIKLSKTNYLERSLYLFGKIWLFVRIVKICKAYKMKSSESLIVPIIPSYLSLLIQLDNWKYENIETQNTLHHYTHLIQQLQPIKRIQNCPRPKHPKLGQVTDQRSHAGSWSWPSESTPWALAHWSVDVWTDLLGAASPWSMALGTGTLGFTVWKYSAALTIAHGWTCDAGRPDWPVKKPPECAQ